MRHATAVHRLRTIAQSCQRLGALQYEEPILRSAYAFGTVLDSTDDLDWVRVAFVLNLPADELTWWARPSSCAGLPHQLEIHKAPVDWYWRPVEWPVSNHAIRRPMCIWSTAGPDEAALDALSRGEAEPFRLPAPAPDEQAKQLAVELAAAMAHLQRVRDRYWDREWRAEHMADGRFPENHLWDATYGYLDLLAAVEAAVRLHGPR